MENPALSMIREVFASHKFQSKSEPEKQAAIERLLGHPILTSNGVSRDDISRLLGEHQQYSSDTLRNLSRDPLYLILERSRPIDVLKLCQTTPAFAKLCRDQDTFKRLMVAHFPEQALAEDFKIQYQGAATGNGQLYEVYIPYGYKTDPKRYPRIFKLVGSFTGNDISKFLPIQFAHPTIPGGNPLMALFGDGPAYGDAEKVVRFRVYGIPIDSARHFWHMFDNSEHEPEPEPIQLPIAPFGGMIAAPGAAFGHMVAM